MFALPTRGDGLKFGAYVFTGGVRLQPYTNQQLRYGPYSQRAKDAANSKLFQALAKIFHGRCRT